MTNKEIKKDNKEEKIKKDNKEEKIKKDNKEEKIKKENKNKEEKTNDETVEALGEKEPKRKKDYKAMYEKSRLENDRLNKKNRELIFENNKNIDAFQDKAKGFQTKAQKEINKVKEELMAKALAESQETKKYGAQSLLENILEPINNIDIAIAAGQRQNDPGILAYVQGFKMLMAQLFSELENYGIKVIEPKEGDVYDPELHQAFSMVEGGETNTISQIKKKGYKLHDRVIKPSIVVVYK